MIKKNLEILTLLTIITNDGAGTGHNLLSITILVDLAETNPLTKLLSIGNLDKLNLMFSAESLNQTHILLLLTALSEHTKMGGTTIQGLYSLTETTDKTIVVEGTAKDLTEGSLNSDGTGSLGGRNFNDNISFSGHFQLFPRYTRSVSACKEAKIWNVPSTGP
jgi:hypothetical protein